MKNVMNFETNISMRWFYKNNHVMHKDNSHKCLMNFAEQYIFKCTGQPQILLSTITLYGLEAKRKTDPTGVISAHVPDAIFHL